MNLLVTGGAGFIGSNIVEELLKRGDKVRILDNFSTGKRSNIAPFEKDIEVIEGDIRSYHIAQKAVKGIEVILHQAALPSVPRSVADPITSTEVNINGTLNMLYAAKENNVKRFVFASSSSVYGDTPVLPKNESMTPSPLTPYAVNKLTGEHFCKVFNNLYGLETIVLRYFNVFGPRQDPDSQYSAVIPKFIKLLANNQTPTIFGDGTQSRDFTYIANVVEGNILAATAICEPPLVMNCATRGEVTLSDLVKQINSILKKDISPIYAAPRNGDIKHSYADIALISEKLKYETKVSFAEGLKRTVDYYSALNSK